MLSVKTFREIIEKVACTNKNMNNVKKNILLRKHVILFIKLTIMRQLVSKNGFSNWISNWHYTEMIETPVDFYSFSAIS